jgi:PleD family two-component response regulator
MLNAAIADSPTTAQTSGDLVVKKAAPQRVMIVNGSPQILELLEAVLEEGHYDVVFVESNDHAYSQIKRVQPDLVILCVCIEDIEGFQVLSMLKLDDDTRSIPVLTYTTEYEARATEEETPDVSDTALFTVKRAEMMN